MITFIEEIHKLSSNMCSLVGAVIQIAVYKRITGCVYKSGLLDYYGVIRIHMSDLIGQHGCSFQYEKMRMYILYLNYLHIPVLFSPEFPNPHGSPFS